MYIHKKNHYNKSLVKFDKTLFTITNGKIECEMLSTLK